jgi:hypothetical protein
MCTLTSWIRGQHPAHSHGWGHRSVARINRTLVTVSARSSFWCEKIFFSFCTSGCSRELSWSLPFSSTATSSTTKPRRSSSVLFVRSWDSYSVHNMGGG